MRREKETCTQPHQTEEAHREDNKDEIKKHKSAYDGKQSAASELRLERNVCDSLCAFGPADVPATDEQMHR